MTTPACTWQLVRWQSPQDARLDRGGHTATVVGNKIFIAGGRRGSIFYNDVFIFDCETAQVTQPIAHFPPGVKARANHTATLIGSHIWFVGGGDDDDVFDDVFTLDINTLTWQRLTPTDPFRLLARTAHAAEVHPRMPSVILVTGGYGPLAHTSDTYDMLDDIFQFDTVSCSTERIVPLRGPVVPPRRAYHSMSVIGDHAYIFGGRRPNGVDSAGRPRSFVMDGPDLLGMFDLKHSKWVVPSAKGTAPSPRSSHRAVTVHDRIIIYGGAAASGSQAPTQRLTDLHSLLVLPDGQLLWSCDSPASVNSTPQGRSAHTLSVVGDTLYVICGYKGATSSKSHKKYAMDCWSMQLRHELFKTSAAAQLPSCATAQAPSTLCQKRYGAAACAAVAPTPLSPAKAGLVCGGPDANEEAVNMTTWHTVKRQRSMVKAYQQQQQQPQQQPQQQLHKEHPAADGHLQLQQQTCKLKGQQQGLFPRPEREGAGQHPGGHADYEQAFTAAVAAAVAAMGQINVAAPGSRSPLQAGRLPREQCCGDTTQQVDGMRGQLEQYMKVTSSLEAEVRLLRKQLADAKEEARQDKEAAERKLQDQQVEAARQRTLAEQALMRQQRAQEDAALAQQDLSTAKQQLQKAGLEQAASQQQLQSLHSEIRKLRNLRTETDRELQQLQLLVQQQQQQERRLQEQLLRERQQQQDDVAAARACTEQHRMELRRLSDMLANEKQKSHAAVSEHRQQCAVLQEKLQEAERGQHDLQSRLNAATSATADARKQRDEAMQALQAAQEQFASLDVSHKALIAENSQLQSELSKAREQQAQLQHEAGKRQAAGINLQAALGQLQTAMQTALHASAQL